MKELKVTIDKIIPYTTARATFSQILDEVARDNYLVIARRYKPAAVVASVDYFNKLKSFYDKEKALIEMRKARRGLQEEFNGLLRKMGKDPQTISEAEVNKILGIQT